MEEFGSLGKNEFNTEGDVVEPKTKTPAPQLKSVPCSQVNNLHSEKGFSFSL